MPEETTFYERMGDISASNYYQRQDAVAESVVDEIGEYAHSGIYSHTSALDSVDILNLVDGKINGWPNA